ncbi:cytochrome c oxidase subunit 5B, mitochondrial-like [Brevipalpus obovatus]|uniref:cytochrome c oxidase subunit 5B, mitochondrial-like n=1 Tax=Brevipalpus obovatus TaxID=246614 RepID=UPI003D9ED10A
MGKIPAHIRPVFDTPLNRLKVMLKKRGVLASFLDTYDINKGGTRDEPLMVPMISDSRIIGCQCHEDQEHLVYHRVLADELKQCTCGYFFKGMQISNPFIAYDLNYEIPDEIRKQQEKEKKQ